MVVNLSSKVQHHIEPTPAEREQLLARRESFTRPAVTAPVKKDEKKAPMVFYNDEFHDMFHDTKLSYAILQSIVKTAYDTFKVFNGTMESVYKQNNVDTLRSKLGLFFARYLELQPIDPVSLSIFEVLDGIEFLPVDASIFLKIQSFINHTQDQFPEIYGAMFFYEDNLIFSGITHEEARIIKRYMPGYLDERFKQLNCKMPEEGFLTGINDANAQKITFSAPKVYLECFKEGRQELQEALVIVFRVSIFLWIIVCVLHCSCFLTLFSNSSTR